MKIIEALKKIKELRIKSDNIVDKIRQHSAAGIVNPLLKGLSFKWQVIKCHRF